MIRTPRSPQVVRSLLLATLCGSAVVAVPRAASAITFTDIAEGNQAGITYRRGESTIDAALDAIKLRPVYDLPSVVASPFRSKGVPGVAVFDFDNDGDLDVYVTNGPNRANSLYKNMLVESGQLTFQDVGAAAGVGATDQDSTGVCYGDIDNDGDEDLYVLGRSEGNRLFKNNGDGTFTNITAGAQIAAGTYGHSSCAFGDIDGDGFLDIAIANAFDWSKMDAIYNDSFSYNHPNQLFRNQGNNTFTDVSASSGIRNLGFVPPGSSTISWSVTLVDFDGDGDLDLMHADDQGAMAPPALQGISRGLLQLFENDGAGHFTNVNGRVGLTAVAAFMGQAWGDYDCDGNLDVFATNQGDHVLPHMGFPVPPGNDGSRVFRGLGGPDHKMQDSYNPAAQGPPQDTPFGWGTGAFDYDNDGDLDITYFGSLDANEFLTADNPGIILQNQGCTGQFVWDRPALQAQESKNLRRATIGVGLGDLNDDGFVDIVHVANEVIPETIPLVPFTQLWGSPYDQVAFYAPLFSTIGPLEWEWNGIDTQEGTLGVQISSADNGNRWARVKLRGSKGTLATGKSPRDGIGALVSFTPAGGKKTSIPVMGGSSYASQHALEQTFGLGTATAGTLEIMWPGGKKNRLYDVTHQERLTMPEIPCSYAGGFVSRTAYRSCVDGALSSLRSARVVSGSQSARLKSSAYRAWDETH